MAVPDYPLYLTGYWPHYRSLRLAEPQQQGWDVYALQTGLQVDRDGVFGKKTESIVRQFQGNHGLWVDGIAGGLTQRALGMVFVHEWTRREDLPKRLLMGQIEHESSFLVGNQSPTRSDGHADCGICQRNSEHTAPSTGFNVSLSVQTLAQQIGAKHKQYRELGNADRKSWELAAGSWNAPAFTNWLAGVRDTSSVEPGPTALGLIEAYINDVTAYVRW